LHALIKRNLCFRCWAGAAGCFSVDDYVPVNNNGADQPHQDMTDRGSAQEGQGTFIEATETFDFDDEQLRLLMEPDSDATASEFDTEVDDDYDYDYDSN